MKIYFLLFVVLLCAGTACNKFETKDVTTIPECTYCHLADSIDGSYTGRLVERDRYGYTYDTILDTMITVYVDRTFSGLNKYEDSIIFKFDCSYFHDQIFLTEESIQTGKFRPIGDNKVQKFTEDNQMLVSSESSVQLGFGWSEDYVSLQFKGYKDE